MNQIKFNFTNSSSLVYNLNNSTTANYWLDSILRHSVDDLLKNGLNSFHGNASLVKVDQNLTKLRYLAKVLGLTLPLVFLDSWQQSLNELHLNFPEMLASRTNNDNVNLLHEMNLTIHWLEQELCNYNDNRNKFTINLDFNHTEQLYSLTKKIPTNELENFSTDIKFGDLYLHYIFIGRHFLELFDAQDVVCPKNQFRPQTHFNATCGMSFSEPENLVLKEDSMKKYFISRGGKDYFGHDYESPLLCKGFFKLGTLSNVSEFETKEARLMLKNTLFTQTILSWENPLI